MNRVVENNGGQVIHRQVNTQTERWDLTLEGLPI